MICPECGGKREIVWLDRRFNPRRGTCPRCGGTGEVTRFKQIKPEPSHEFVAGQLALITLQDLLAREARKAKDNA
jgi:hypothetical protein